MKRYVKISDPESGDVYLNPETGEVFQPHDDMYIITSTRAIRARAKSSERLRRIQAERHAPAYGDFCWVCYPDSGDLFPGISSTDAARLLYLATHMGYDGYLQKNGQHIHPSELPSLLQVQPREARNFRARVSTYLCCDQENYLLLQGGVFHRGTLAATDIAAANQNGMKYIRLYHPAIRQLYQSKKKEDRILLRFLAAFLTLLHPQRNSLCKGCQALSWRQLWKAIGRDPSHVSRDKAALLQVRIKTTHGTEKVLAYDGNEIYLNPRVAFSGTRGDAEPLRHLFKDAGSNNLLQISGQARPPNSFQGTLPWTSFKPNKTTPRKDN